MKKTINLKRITILVSLLLGTSLFNEAAFAAPETTIGGINQGGMLKGESDVKSDTTTDKVTTDISTEATKETPVKKPVEINPVLKKIIGEQKDAQTLLSDPTLNVDATLGDLSKYSALTAIQDAKNKLEDSATKNDKSESKNNSNDQGMNNNNNYSQDPNLNNANPNTAVDNRSIKPVDGKLLKQPKPVIKATAVYTLGSVGYAELNYNGSKNVVRRGDKLPGGEIVESLTPLGVIIKDKDGEITLPIVGADAPSANGQSQSRNQQANQDYTLTAPRASN